MKIYTKTGDDGTTGLFGGRRVSKASMRVEAYGCVDELNSVLGLARSALTGDAAPLDGELQRVQETLFTLGADLATPPDAKTLVPRLEGSSTVGLEGWIDTHEEELEPLTSFILPSGSHAGAALHLARTVCRRAERAVLRLGQSEPISDAVLPYLNRLSDYLFVVARVVNHRLGEPETPWMPKRQRGQGSGEDSAAE